MRRRLRGAVAATAVCMVLAGCSTGPEDFPTVPTCDHSSVLILEAQSVPSAAYVPCISQFPAGWTFGGEHIDAGHATFWMDSDRAGTRAVTVTLAPRCDPADAVEVPVEPDEAGTTRFEEPESLPPAYVADRFYVFPGGCVTYHFAFQSGGTFTHALEATSALTFLSRAKGVVLLQREGLTLCGRGVDCPG